MKIELNAENTRLARDVRIFRDKVQADQGVAAEVIAIVNSRGLNIQPSPNSSTVTPFAVALAAPLTVTLSVFSASSTSLTAAI